MTQEEALTSPKVVTGMLTIFDRDVYVLFNQRATHSFVSHSFALYAKVKPSSLDANIIVSIPLGNSKVYEKVCKDCMVKIGECEVPANLVPLELHGLDAILGMDWLSHHHAIVDCFKKIVKFKHPGENKFSFQKVWHVLPPCLILTITARKILRKGCQAYHAYVVDIKS